MASRDESDYLGSDLIGEGDAHVVPPPRPQTYAAPLPAVRVSERTTPSKGARIVVGKQLDGQGGNSTHAAATQSIPCVLPRTIADPFYRAF